MELSEYRNIFDHESEHFFYRANHTLFLSLIQTYFPNRHNLKILDAGCGTGLLLQKLEIFGQAQGVDISPEALKFCRQRKVKAIKASLNRLPFRANTFDLVTSMDVLYHRQVNDSKALAEIYRVLKPGGLCIIRVPANKWLKLAHDTHVHTRERYTRAELLKKLMAAQFEIKKISYVNAVFLLLAILKFAWEKFHSSQQIESGVSDPPNWLNISLIKIADIECSLLRYVSLPFGLGVAAVAQK